MSNKGNTNILGWVVENNTFPTREEKRRMKRFTGRRNTKGYPIGYNNRTWIDQKNDN